ncbi:MAG: hypothetical protein IPH62_16460 [Ignavibacteriae bacterium]|nr:hypothetical protein [Ignavibacteriota bacterium]
MKFTKLKTNVLFSLVLLILLITAQNLFAVKYYVSPTGNDITGDGSEGNPWHTIQGAIDNVVVINGDTIIVMNGTYIENVDVNKEIIILSENGYNSTIVIASDTNDRVFEITANYVTISGFTCYGSNKVWDGAGIFLGNNTHHCIISNNRSGYDPNHKNWKGIYLYTSSNNIISNNICNYNDEIGIQL